MLGLVEQSFQQQRHQQLPVQPGTAAVRPSLGQLPQSEDRFHPLETKLDLPAMMPPKVEVGWPERPATGPLRVYRAGRGFGFFSFARRFLLAKASVTRRIASC